MISARYNDLFNLTSEQGINNADPITFDIWHLCRGPEEAVELRADCCIQMCISNQRRLCCCINPSQYNSPSGSSVRNDAGIISNTDGKQAFIGIRCIYAGSTKRRTFSMKCHSGWALACD